MQTSLKTILSVVVFLIASAFSSDAATTKVIWHGHAAFEIITPMGKVLMLDPWLRNPMNPDAKGDSDPVAKLKKVDYIFVTHGHSDHVGDAVEIAKKTKARLVANIELGQNLAKHMEFPKDQMGFDTLMNAGGEVALGDGEVTVAMTPAIHSSGLKLQDGDEYFYGGTPVGIVLRIKDGPTIYHTGDTAYFSDMKLIGQNYSPDLALINIGGHFGMEPKMAAQAASDVRAKWVVPMHFKSFPILTQDAAPFLKMVKEKGLHGIEMKPGQTLEFEGHNLKK